MDLNLTVEQREVQRQMRKFAEREFTEKVIKAHEDYFEIDKDGRLKRGKFPWELLPKFAEMGLLNAVETMDAGSNCVIMVVLSKVWPAGALALFAVPNTLTYFPILEFGTKKQKQYYLPKMAKGELLGAFCLTEPNVGSDAAGVECKAKKDGDYWILNGRKTFITSAGEADVLIVFARTRNAEEFGKHKSITAFLVEKDKTVECKKIEKPCLFGSPFYEICFEDTRVHQDNMLGKENEGFYIEMHTLNCGRVQIGAQAIGLLEKVFAMTKAYVQERKQFGKPIGEFEPIKMMLRCMEVELAVSWALMLKAAKMKDAGEKEFVVYASLAKLVATEATAQAARDAFHLHGGMAVTTELPLWKYLLEAETFTIYEGTTEIQRETIQKYVDKFFEGDFQTIYEGLSDDIEKEVVWYHMYGYSDPYQYFKAVSG